MSIIVYQYKNHVTNAIDTNVVVCQTDYEYQTIKKALSSIAAKNSSIKILDVYAMTANEMMKHYLNIKN